MPFAGYKNFAACVKANSSKKNPQAYCAAVMRKTEKGATTKTTTASKVPTKKEALMPREVEVHEIFDAQEATFDDDKMEANVTIIRAGRSKNNRNYGSRVLREAVSEGTFNNMRMFVDHSDKLPLKRSLKEMVSATTTTDYVEDDKGGKIVSLVKFFDKDFYEYAKRAKEHMGDSINSRLRTNVMRQPDGSVYEDVQKILKGYSVDWVLYPAAGGQIDQFFESEGEATVADVDWANVDEDMLKEHVPELYKSILDKAKAEATPPDPDDGDGDDDDDAEAITKESVERMISEARTSWVQEQEEATQSIKKVAETVDASPLPDIVKARIKKSFDGKKYDRTAVKESIEDAQEELKKLGVGPRITGMGVSGSAGDGKAPVGRAQEAVMAVFGMDKQKKDTKTEAAATPGK